MQLYLAILKALLNKANYERYFQTVPLQFIKENYPEIAKLFQCLPLLHEVEASPSGEVFPQRSIPDLQLCYHTNYPASRSSEVDQILQDLESTEVSTDILSEYFERLQQRERATRIAKAALMVSEGLAPESSLADIETQLVRPPTEIATDFVTTNLHELYEHEVVQQGLRWRLDSLNKALGSLRKGDFGFVFARPETGKTTFLASEISHMAAQAQGPILWFNNEEQGSKVITRCYQAALGVSRTQLLADRDGNYRRYLESTGDRIKIVASPATSRKDVERMCRQYNPALLIFDQIDKIKGFSDDRNDLELTAIYEWVRELAKEFAPAIGICQAGNSGDGKRWLTMSDVNNSKTGKQGEADWILGIGKTLDDSQEFVRFLHLSKNKLGGDMDTDEEMRHGKWEVKIRPDIARYEDY